MPSLGFQINNLIPETEIALQTPKDDSNLVGSSAAADVSVETKLIYPMSKTSPFDITLPLKSARDEVSDAAVLVMETMDAKEERHFKLILPRKHEHESVLMDTVMMDVDLTKSLICDENQIGTSLLSNSLSTVSHNQMEILRSRVPVVR
ncbi:hypothetical protein SAY86_019867 [Trapa natans]|uniref:Uncharacterized protein n=1 Tax=Trapa natans TaxID=22666 RepID=A0AAN7LI20_TRANT|nr:hypothetical protein SAY86_019867 [Trapa natans]